MANLIQKLDLLNNAMNTAQAAGNEIMKVYYSLNFGIQYKDEKEPFGIADMLSHEMIVRMLHHKYPDFGILTEEKTQKTDMAKLPETLVSAIEEWGSRDYCWIVDDLDGTMDFINHTGMFGIHIALTHNGEPIVAVNYYPCSNEFYTAIIGEGAYKHTPHQKVPIHVNDIRDMSKLRFALSTAFPDPVIVKIIQENNMPLGVDIGSMGLKICKVADGTASIYLNANKTFGLWDLCSGELIVREAGGVITDMNGNSFDYKQRETKCKHGVLVTNGQIHDNLLSMIRTYYSNKK